MPEVFVGLKYSDISALHAGNQMLLIAVSRATEESNLLSMVHKHYSLIPLDDPEQERAQKGDILTTFGTHQAYKTLFSSL